MSHIARNLVMFVTVVLLLFGYTGLLYPQSQSFYSERVDNYRVNYSKYFRDGNFDKILDNIKKELAGNSNEDELVYLKIWEIKTNFCAGNLEAIDDTVSLRRLTKDYREILYHPPKSELILNCEKRDSCICQKFNFDEDLENLDALYDEDALKAHFFKLYIFIKKDKQDNDNYIIERKSKIKYKGKDEDVKFSVYLPEIEQETDEDYEPGDIELEYEYAKKNIFSQKEITGFLHFKHEYEDGNYTIKPLLIPRILNDSQDQTTYFLLIDDYRYSFEFGVFDKSDQKVNIFLPKDEAGVTKWDLHDWRDDTKISFLYPVDYLSAIEINIDGGGFRDLVNTAKDNKIEYNPEPDDLPFDKWPDEETRYDQNNKRKIGQIEFRIYVDETEANDHKPPGIEKIEFELTENYIGFQEEQKKIRNSKYALLGAIILATVAMSLN